MSAFDGKRRRTQRICLVGWGAIGRRVAQLIADLPRIELAAVAVRDARKLRGDLPVDARLIASPAELERIEVNLVVEAAGRDTVAAWGEAALSRGADFMVSSTSAFCDPDLLSALTDLAERQGGQVIVPPGALGGIDALSAASLLLLERVEHHIVKPPEAWRGTDAEGLVDLDKLAAPTAFFSGSAREAAARFPQNANATVITGLAGPGLDRTVVTLVADPSATRNTHRIEASGAFGAMEMRLENEPLATNPKSSEMTALNLARLIRNRAEALVLA